MSTFIIQGGASLQGEIIPQGAKNEALQVICATLLSEDKIIIRNIPDILDVNNLIDLIRSLNVEVVKLGPSDYSFKAQDVNLDYIHSEDFRTKSTRLRGSIMTVSYTHLTLPTKRI